MLEPEQSKGGSFIRRYSAGDAGPPRMAREDTGLTTAIIAHAEKHFGPVDQMFSGVVQDHVWINLLRIAPTAARPYWTLMTAGMSSRPQENVPESAAHYSRNELVLYLPADWPVSSEAAGTMQWGWVYELIIELAHLPHRLRTWQGPGHTAELAEEPIANTLFTAVLLLLAQEKDEAQAINAYFGEVPILSINMLTSDEMQWTLEHGVHALLEQVQEKEVDVVLDPTRPSIFDESYAAHERASLCDEKLIEQMSGLTWAALAGHDEVVSNAVEGWHCLIQRGIGGKLYLAIRPESDFGKALIQGVLSRTPLMVTAQDSTTARLPLLMPMSSPESMQAALSILHTCKDNWLVA